MKLIHVTLAAEMLCVSVARVYELARSGVLPSGVVVRLGRQLRIDEDALREWIRAGGQALPGGWKHNPDESTPFTSPRLETLSDLNSGYSKAARSRTGRHHG